MHGPLNVKHASPVSALFESPQALTVFPSDNGSTKIEMRTEHEWNYPDEQNP